MGHTCPEQRRGYIKTEITPLSDWTMGPRGRLAMDLTSALQRYLSQGLLSGWPRPEGRHFGDK